MSRKTIVALFPRPGEWRGMPRRQYGSSPLFWSALHKLNLTNPSSNDLALKLCPCRHRVGDRSVFADVLMQQTEAPIVFVCIHGQLVRNRRHEGRTVLTNTVKVDFDAAKLKMKHRRNPLDTLDHAGCDGRKKQFGGIEGVWPALNIGIKPDLRVLAAGQASVRICALRHDVIFEHLRNPKDNPLTEALPRDDATSRLNPFRSLVARDTSAASKTMQGDFRRAIEAHWNDARSSTY
jgi:hypothetical protein